MRRMRARKKKLFCNDSRKPRNSHVKCKKPRATSYDEKMFSLYSTNETLMTFSCDKKMKDVVP